MTVWTREQVRQARGIRARAEIDERYWEVPPSPELVAQFHKRMQRIADTFAIMLDPRDIRTKQTDAAPERTQVTITAWWEPEVHSIEVQGGHEDGRTYEFPGAPNEPLWIAPLPRSVGPFDTTIWPEELPHPITLECVGWHEQERHWIYGTPR